MESVLTVLFGKKALDKLNDDEKQWSKDCTKKMTLGASLGSTGGGAAFILLTGRKIMRSNISPFQRFGFILAGVTTGGLLGILYQSTQCYKDLLALGDKSPLAQELKQIIIYRQHGVESSDFNAVEKIDKVFQEDNKSKD